MATVQGEFSTREQAMRAADALKAAGLAGSQVRIWNVIPDPVKPVDGGYYNSTAYRSAVAGAVVGGVAGAILGGPFWLVAGALGVGGVVGTTAAATAESGEPSLPYPTGARVVVDTASSAEAVALLQKMGAAHVR